MVLPANPHDANILGAAGEHYVMCQLLRRQMIAALAASDRAALAGIERDLRYWKQRRSSARIIAPPAAPEIVRFGVTVSLRFDDGAERRYQLVGEDEADPAAGLISWTSPVGSALIGRGAGDVVPVSGRQAEIVAMQA